MTSDQPRSRRRFVLLGLPHVVTRTLAAYLQTIAAACDPPVDCELATHEREILPTEAALYLRPEATDTRALVASLTGGAGADRLALAERMDTCWEGLPRLPVERVLASPEHAADALSSCLGLPATAEVLTAAQRGIAHLREAMSALDHPLTFWLASDDFGADGFMPDPTDDVASIPPVLTTRVQSHTEVARADAKGASDAAPAEHIFVIGDAGWRTPPASMP